MSLEILKDIAWLGAGLVLGAGGVFFLREIFFKEELDSPGLREELKEAQVRLETKSREIKTLQDTVRYAVSPTDLAAALAGIVSIVTRHLEVDLVAFLLLDEVSQELVTQPGAYGLEKEEQMYRISLLDENSSSVRVFRTGKPFVAGDAQDDPGVITHYAKLWDIRSLIVVPVSKRGHPWGVMRVGSRKPYAFTQEHIDLMSAIAEDAAIIIEMSVLNQQLIADREQLRALSRMKDEFVSTVSHEFKTPLTTLAGFLGLMLEGEIGPISEDQRRFMVMAKNAVERLSNMVSDLLDISRLESGMKMEIRAFSLTPLISSILESHKLEAASAKKEIHWDYPKNLPEVLADQKWISVVIENLVSNALKFTNPGGRITVCVFGKGDWVETVVEDDGIGLSQEALSHIFEKFYRALNARELNIPGTGLGLAISKKILDLNGGRLWLESVLGKGTRAHFAIYSVNRYGVSGQNKAETAQEA
jgi:signal transduction histidine kinase